MLSQHVPIVNRLVWVDCVFLFQVTEWSVNILDDQRRAIIIKEIHYWRDSKLLPAHFCDFLLALYTQGEKENEELSATLTVESANNQISLLNVAIFTSNLFIVPLSFTLLYFTDLTRIFQTVFIIFILLLLTGYYIYIKKKFDVKTDYPLIIMLVSICLLSVFIIDLWSQSVLLSLSVVVAQLVGWLVLGFRLHFRILIIIAALGILVNLFAIIF